MIRIFHVVGGLGNGGAETLLKLLLSKSSNDPDRELTLLVLESYDRQVHDLAKTNVRAFYFDLKQESVRSVIARAGKRLFQILRLARFLLSERPHIVQSWLYFPDLIIAPFAKLVGAKIIWGIFLSELQKSYYKRSTWIAIRLCGRLARWIPNRIVSCTIAGGESHVEIGYPKEKLEVVFPGIDPMFFRKDSVARSQIREHHGVEEETVVIGMVARWDPQKNHELFLKP